MWFAAISTAVICIIVLGRRRRTWAAVGILVLLCVGVTAGLREHQLHTSLPAQWAAEARMADAVVELVGDPRLVDSGNRPALLVANARLLELATADGRLATRQPVVIFASSEVAQELLAVAPGTTFSLRAALATADAASPDALVLRARHLTGEVSPPRGLDRLVNSLRAGLRDSASHSRPDQAALVPSLVVGDTSGIRNELSEQFRVTSLSHLLAVSGANLTLLLVVVLAVARSVGLRGWSVRVLAVFCVLLFVLVCRNEPSVVRAAAMGLVSLSAMGIGRGRRSLRHLALAVLCLMLIDPWLARTWGFALSVAACAGLTLVAPTWTRALTRWLPRWVAEALTIPLAAQLATQPLITALNGQVSAVGVFANMLAAPFVGPATVLGLAAMCLVWLQPLAIVTAWLAGWCVQPILWVAAFGSSLPAAAWAWPADVLGIVLCVVGCLAVGLLIGPLLERPLGLVGLCVVLIVASMIRPSPLGWPGPWQAVFCDVGQGDATVLRAGEGVAVLVDTGPDAAGVLGCLASLGIREVPVLVLTHFHSDHVGGAQAVMDRFEPELVVVSPLASPAVAAELVRNSAGRIGARVVEGVPGQRFSVGDVAWTTVGAHRPRVVRSGGLGESGDENDSSVVGLADVSGLRVLLPGDVEPAGQRRALAAAAAAGLTMEAHVLKLPHHGSARQEDEFFRATGAVLAIASSGRDNDYGHPAVAALDLALQEGMAVARTDLDGHVAVAWSQGELLVRRAGFIE